MLVWLMGENTVNVVARSSEKMAKNFEIGDKVIAQKAPGGEWHDAVIQLVAKNGNFVVRFADEFVCSLTPEEVRPGKSQAIIDDSEASPQAN